MTDSNEAPVEELADAIQSLTAQNAYLVRMIRDGAQRETIIAANFAKAEADLKAERAKVAALVEGLGNLANAKADYRLTHDQFGDGGIQTNRAWDNMRRSGIAARALIERDKAVITDAMKADGWIEHNGGECPTSDAVRVLMINYSGGLTEFPPSPANGMNWNLKNQPGAILAYRPEPKL